MPCVSKTSSSTPKRSSLPVGVDLVALDEEVHRGLGQPGLSHQLEEPPLEPGAGEDRLLVVELQRRADLGLSPVPLGAPEQVLHLPQVEDLQVFARSGPVHAGPSQRTGRRDVEDRPWRAR